MTDPHVQLYARGGAYVLAGLVLAAAGCLSCGALGDTILQFAFMSMGLRGAVIFAPLLWALWLPGKVRAKFATAAVIAGPVVVLVFGLWKILPFDSLFAGIGIALLIMIVGLLHKPVKEM